MANIEMSVLLPLVNASEAFLASSILPVGMGCNKYKIWSFD